MYQRKEFIINMANNGIELERDGFKSRTGFILACIGSAVGMGNKKRRIVKRFGACHRKDKCSYLL